MYKIFIYRLTNVLHRPLSNDQNEFIKIRHNNNSIDVSTRLCGLFIFLGLCKIFASSQ